MAEYCSAVHSVENVLREITTGICRLQHGSPDNSEKDVNGDGVNDDYKVCMGEGFSVQVGFNGEGEATGIGGTLPGTGGVPIWIGLVTDEDRRRQEQRILAQNENINSINNAVQQQFHRDPGFPELLAQLIETQPSDFIRPFGEMIKSNIEMIPNEQPYTSITGEKYPNKRAFLRELTLGQIGDLESMLSEINDYPLSNERMMIAQFAAATLAVATTTIAALGPLASPGVAAGFLIVGTFKDFNSGDDVTLRLLLRGAKLPYLVVGDAWSLLATIPDQHADALEEKKRITKKIQMELNLLKTRAVELQK